MTRAAPAVQPRREQQWTQEELLGFIRAALHALDYDYARRCDYPF